MTDDLRQIKKRIYGDWEVAYPQLSPYTSNKLYKRIGPILIGIELIRLREAATYRPYFVIYPLWKNGLKACLEYPILLKQFYNSNSAQYDIGYEKHYIVFNGVSEAIKSQLPVSLDKNVSLNELIKVLEEHSNCPPLSASRNSYLQAQLSEAKMLIALYISSSDAENVLTKINNVIWDDGNFKYFDVEVNSWLKSLRERVNNRELFLKGIETNAADKKVSKLKENQLIP